ncbi:MAG: metal ABC transporter substrate-binding protein [Actinomycetota bacterium]
MRRLLIPALALLLAAPACDAIGGPDVSVVAAIYPLAWVAAEVGGDRVGVLDLTAPGVEAHDATLTAGQRAELQSADVVLLLGVPGFQPDVERASEEASGAVVDVTAVLDLLPGEGDLAADPHFWLDPLLLAQTVPLVAAAFAAADEGNADAYLANAAALEERLVALDAEIREGLAACASTTFVTTHEAFTYFARAYGLEQLALEGPSPDAEPSAEAIERVLAAIADGEAAPAVFAEATAEGRRIGGAIAEDAGVVLYGLATLESDPAPVDYVGVMRANLDSLAEGLSCR